MPIPAFTTTLQKTHIEMCRANIHGHTDSKCFLQSSIYEVVIQEWTFTISLPNFLFSFLCLYLYCFFENATRTPFGYNLSCRIMKCKNKNSKICDSLSKMPFDECSAAMGFQIGFKSVGFFSVFECYCVFDPPWSEFRCMRHIAFIVFFKAGF